MKKIREEEKWWRGRGGAAGGGEGWESGRRGI